MFRILLPLRWLAVFWALGSIQAQAQDTLPRLKADEIERLADLHDYFQKIADPPLAMGDTGDRVRELQATLNHALSGRTIELLHEIQVGPALGDPDTPERGTQRFAYSEHRNKAFQIRGDWIPLDASRAVLFKDGDTVAHREAFFLRLPEKPLKADGIFGQHTQAAVALFQHLENLPVTGEVDAVTLDKLEPLVPTNRLLALLMSWVASIFDDKHDYYPNLVKTVTALLATALILIAAAVVFQIARSLARSTHFLSRWLFTPESSPWFTALYNSRFFRQGAQFGPAIFIYFSGRLVFPAPAESEDVFPYLNTFQTWQTIVSHLGLAYMSLVLMLVGFAAANAVDAVINPDRDTDNPIGSIVRAAKRIIGLLGTLLIIASLAGKSPFLIVGGLGAFMAVFMLVFKDYLLGMVSSVQIIANKVVEIGDWITMPKYNADGDVQKISLTLITVQNSDKTISTIPTSAVLSESFQNWTGVENTGGRRIKRSILIDMRRIRVCSAEMIERFERIELISDYLENKRMELEEYNRKHKTEASPVNSRRLTNIGTFRAYLDAYLRHHAGLSGDLTILVRHLQPTSNGLPIEIYAFCNTTEWAKYEAVQADIFDHILAILPEFGLRTFQELTDNVEDSPAPDETLSSQAGLAELESLVAEKNRELAANPRTQPASRLRALRKRIAELELEDHFAVRSEGRTIEIDHLRG